MGRCEKCTKWSINKGNLLGNVGKNQLGIASFVDQTQTSCGKIELFNLMIKSY